MPRLACTALLAWMVLGSLGCASSQHKKHFKPLEEDDAKLPPPRPVPPPDPTPAPEATDTSATPAAAATECVDRTDCQFKGPPGKGLRWACTDGQCVGEPKKKRHHHSSSQ